MPNRLPQLRGCPASPGRQRGATLVFTAFTLVALVATMGLAIDVGRLYATQTQLQRTAEVAALDAASALGGCGFGTPSPPESCNLGPNATEWETAQCAVDNAIDNQSDDDGAPAISNDLDLGIQQSDGSRLTFQPSDQFDADSARVTLTRPAPKPLVAFFTTGNQLTATAAARSRPAAGISIGSSLLGGGGSGGAVETGLLGALLGIQNLSVVSSQGLATASITLGDLATELGVATPEDLLTINSANVDSLLGSIANVLDSTGTAVDATAAATLDTLAAAVGDAPGSNLSPIDLADIFNFEPGIGDTASDTLINVADIVGALAQAANQGSPISLPVGINLGGLATANATVNIIEPPQFDFGRAGRDGQDNPRTVARTAQAVIQLNLQVLSGGVLGGGGSVINLPIYIKAASAEVSLEDIQCAGRTVNAEDEGRFQHFVTLSARTSIADIGIGEFDDISAFNPQPPASGQPIDLVNLDPGGLLPVITVTTETSQVTLGDNQVIRESFTGPYPVGPRRVGTDVSGALNAGLSDLGDDVLANMDIELLGGGLLGGLLGSILNVLGFGSENGLLQAVFGLLNPVLAILDDQLIEPILNLLGLSIGNADLTVQSVVVDQTRVFCTSGTDCGLTNN